MSLVLYNHIISEYIIIFHRFSFKLKFKKENDDLRKQINDLK